MHPTDIKQDEFNNNSTANQRRERPPRMQNSGGRRDPEPVQGPSSQLGAAANRQPPWVQNQQAPAAQPQVWAHQQQSSNSPAAAPITAPTIDTAPFSAQSFLEKRLQEFKYGFLENLKGEMQKMILDMQCPVQQRPLVQPPPGFQPQGVPLVRTPPGHQLRGVPMVGAPPPGPLTQRTPMEGMYPHLFSAGIYQEGY